MGEKCSKKECGCSTVTSSTIYWCKECNIPVFEKECPVCGHGCDYIATDIRPVFPEESALLGIILKNQFDYYLKKSIWYGSNVYIVDGEKVKISISKLNKMPIESIREIKDKYDSIASQIDYDYFNKHVNRFVEANVDRYNSITEEAVNYIQR